VHWVRARARLHRWEEEITRTQNEMHWVTNYFIYRQRQWITWKTSIPDLHAGHEAYAERQSAMWADLGRQAHRLFADTWSDFNKDPTVFI